MANLTSRDKLQSGGKMVYASTYDVLGTNASAKQLRWALHLLDQEQDRSEVPKSIDIEWPSPTLRKCKLNRIGKTPLEWTSTQFENVSVALTAEDNSSFQYVIYAEKRLFNCSAFHISTPKILHLLTSISSSTTKITLNKVVYSKGIHDARDQQRASSIEWMRGVNLSYLEDLFSEGAWLKLVEFSVNDGTRHGKARGSISRAGHLKSLGCHDIFYEVVILPIIKYANLDYELFKGRSRTDSNNFNVRPLALGFKRNPFAQDGKQRILDAISTIEGMSISVYNSEKYFLASLVDTVDGSSYTITVFSDDTMFLSPQHKASVSSLERIVSQLGEVISEPRVQDYNDWVRSEADA